MKTDASHSIRNGFNKIKKLWVMIVIMVLLIVHIGFFILKDFSLGYRYYEFNQDINTQITLGYSRERIDILSTMNEYLSQLENDGYYVVSCDVNRDIFERACIVPQSKIDENGVKELFIKSFDVSIFCKKVTIGKDIYYFKNEEDKQEFINKVKNIKDIKYDSEEVIEDKTIITKQAVLDKKINTLQEEKKQEEEKKKQEEIRKQQVVVTSRGGNVRKQQSSYSNGVPLQTYSYISSYYGMRNGRMHTGIDFAAPSGTKIYAWKSGTVIQASWAGSYGNFIVIQHSDGTISRYAHCSGYACSKGDYVSKGQVIGYVGTTGNSTGNHLHFEIKINGNFVNPSNYL